MQICSENVLNDIIAYTSYHIRKFKCCIEKYKILHVETPHESESPLKFRIDFAVLQKVSTSDGVCMSGNNVLLIIFL